MSLLSKKAGVDVAALSAALGWQAARRRRAVLHRLGDVPGHRRHGQGHAARDIHRMPRDFAIALSGMHVAHVYARSFHLDRAYKDRARAHCIDIHMAVCLVFSQLFRGDAILMWRAHKECSEIAGIVAIGHWHRRAGAKLPHERPHANKRARHIGWREVQDRMLTTFIRQS